MCFPDFGIRVGKILDGISNKKVCSILHTGLILSKCGFFAGVLWICGSVVVRLILFSAYIPTLLNVKLKEDRLC